MKNFNLTRTELRTELKKLRTQGYTNIKLNASTDDLRNEYTRLEGVFSRLSDIADEHTQEFEDEDNKAKEQKLYEKGVNIYKQALSYYESFKERMHFKNSWYNPTNACNAMKSALEYYDLVLKTNPNHKGAKLNKKLAINTLTACENFIEAYFVKQNAEFEEGCWYKSEDENQQPIKCIKITPRGSQVKGFLRYGDRLQESEWIEMSQQGQYIESIAFETPIYAYNKIDDPTEEINKKQASQDKLNDATPTILYAIMSDLTGLDCFKLDKLVYDREWDIMHIQKKEPDSIELETAKKLLTQLNQAYGQDTVFVMTCDAFTDQNHHSLLRAIDDYLDGSTMKSKTGKTINPQYVEIQHEQKSTFKVGKSYIERSTGKHLKCTENLGCFIQLIDNEGFSDYYRIKKSHNEEFVSNGSSPIYACDEVEELITA